MPECWFVLHWWRWVSTGFVQCTYCTGCRSVTWAPGSSVLGSKFILWTAGTLGLGLLRKAPQPVLSLLRTLLPLSSMPLAQLLTEHLPVAKADPRTGSWLKPCSTRHSRFLGTISEDRVAGTTLNYSWLSSCRVGSWNSIARLYLQLYFFAGFMNLHFGVHIKCLKARSSPVPFSISSQIQHFWQLSHCLPAGTKRCEQGVVLRLMLVICRWCYTTSGGVLAPEILVNSYMVPASTYPTPLRFLFFLGILGQKGFITAVWWKMSKLLFLNRDAHHPPNSPVAGAFS